jgi:hypothetical protein
MLRQAEIRLKSEFPDEERKEAAIFHIKKRLGHKRELYRIPKTSYQMLLTTHFPEKNLRHVLQATKLRKDMLAFLLKIVLL